MKPKVYTSKDHHIHNQLIDSHALEVLRTLHKAGFEAYLVGGGVRDLLMRKRPKDFDISTSAKPEEVKKLFRRCFLVGRRFRLAHVLFGKKVIEVSTFRAGDTESDELITQDNLWGTPEQDVLRRDFTINGLYYDPLDHRIIDFVGGFKDLEAHLLKSIGDPLVRFKQDPVRMIRLQKFRARFGFHVEPKTLSALNTCRQEIVKSSPARLLEEMFRMLESGAAKPFFELLLESGFLKILFPSLTQAIQKEPLRERLFSFLEAADSLRKGEERRPLTRPVLVAALIFPLVESEIERLYISKEKRPHLGEIFDLCHKVTDETIQKAFQHFPRRIRFRALAVTELQFRLTPLDPKKKLRTRIVQSKDFSDALFFLKLRSLVDGGLFKAYTRWKQIAKEAREAKES